MFLNLNNSNLFLQLCKGRISDIFVLNVSTTIVGGWFIVFVFDKTL